MPYPSKSPDVGTLSVHLFKINLAGLPSAPATFIAYPSSFVTVYSIFPEPTESVIVRSPPASTSILAAPLSVKV